MLICPFHHDQDINILLKFSIVQLSVSCEVYQSALIKNPRQALSKGPLTPSVSINAVTML